MSTLFISDLHLDEYAPWPALVAGASRALSDRGVPVHFIHGNRDFLLGPDYAARAGMTLLHDGSVVDLAGERTLLMHGDTL